jgi:hypothetical protein
MLENVMRGTGVSVINKAKTHRKRNHEFTPENTRIMKGGGRQCRECDKLKHRFYRQGIPY